jgi:hypothetical protein
MCVTVWLIGLAIRILIRLLRLLLLLVMAGLWFTAWLRQRRVLEGEILPPQKQITVRR